MLTGHDSSDDELELLDNIQPLPDLRYSAKRKNPFDQYDDDEFRERFRLTKVTTLKVLCEIEHLLEYDSDRNNSVTPMNQLLITLRFLATGTFQLVIGDMFGVGKSTVCSIIKKVVPILASLSKKYIKFPATLDELRQNMKRFYEQSGFPGLIGAVDGTHVPIFSPGGNYAEAYRNRKGYFSFNVQLISDPSLYITDVVARWPGSTHDSTIFDFSHKFAMFENGEVLEGSLVGDSGYACRDYLLTPLLAPKTQAEENYNKSHVQARNCIERVNGVLKRRFAILKYGLRVKTDSIPSIVVATVVLHNIATMVGEDEPPMDRELSDFLDQQKLKGCTVDFEQPEDYLPAEKEGTANTTRRSALIRDHFT